MREHSDGRRHEAPVRDLFGGDERLGAAEFVARLGEVDPRPAMGARPADVTSDFDAAAAEGLVRKVVGGDEVSREAWGDALVAISGEAHGVAWRPWAKALVGCAAARRRLAAVGQGARRVSSCSASPGGRGPRRSSGE